MEKYNVAELKPFLCASRKSSVGINKVPSRKGGVIIEGSKVSLLFLLFQEEFQKHWPHGKRAPE